MILVRDLVKVGDSIVSHTEQYKVEKIMGSGSYGVVSLCNKSSTDQKVALKMTTEAPDNRDDLDDEGNMMKFLMESGGARFHIVHWFGSFKFKKNYVHEFEPLDISLLDFIRENGRLQLKEIRPIIYQMGSALYFLKRLGIVHTDLKPDNVMMVNRSSKLLQIKIIDFGLAQYEENILQGTRLQAAPYRAPEAFLGAPCDQAIDMWSTGCVIMVIFLGYMLFKGNNDNKAFHLIVNTVGLPADSLLFKGHYTNQYLMYKNLHWAFRGSKRPVNTSNNLHFHILSKPLNGVNKNERALFLDLIIRMLKPDPAERITPEGVLRHPFVTLAHRHLLDPDYVSECMKIMCDVLPCATKRRTEVDTHMDVRTSEEQTAPCSHKCSREDEDRIEEEESRSNKRHCVEPLCVSTVRRKRLCETEVKPSNLHNDCDIPPKKHHQENSVIDLTCDSEVPPKKHHQEISVMDLTCDSEDSLRKSPVQDSEPEPRPSKKRRHSN